jgi:hypothetical protein
LPLLLLMLLLLLLLIVCLFLLLLELELVVGVWGCGHVKVHRHRHLHRRRVCHRRRWQRVLDVGLVRLLCRHAGVPCGRRGKWWEEVEWGHGGCDGRKPVRRNWHLVLLHLGVELLLLLLLEVKLVRVEERGRGRSEGVVQRGEGNAHHPVRGYVVVHGKGGDVRRWWERDWAGVMWMWVVGGGGVV